MEKEKFQAENQQQAFSKRNIPLTALVFATFATFCTTLFFNYASNYPSLGLFSKTNAQVSKENELYITPSGWTFTTWVIIYLWQAAWMICMIVFVFVKTDVGYVFMDPVVLTETFYIFVISNLVFNITWLFLFTNEQFWAAFVIICLLTASLYGALFISHRNVYQYRKVLERKSCYYLWVYRILINNGIAFYATWVSIATMINLGIALFRSGVSIEVASNISLSILAVIIVVYFVLDSYVFEGYLRFTFSPYLQLAIAFAGVLSKNWVYQNSTVYFALVLAILAPGLMFMAKILLVIRKIKY